MFPSSWTVASAVKQSAAAVLFPALAAVQYAATGVGRSIIEQFFVSMLPSYQKAFFMRRTHKKVSASPKRKRWTRITAAEGVEQSLHMLEGRWKLLILFQLFGGEVKRFSDLERAIPAVTQKMLAQQLRQMEKDGIVHR